MFQRISKKTKISNQRFYSFWWTDSSVAKPNFKVVQPTDRLPMVDLSQIPKHVRIPAYAQTGKSNIFGFSLQVSNGFVLAKKNIF
jgi:hypothetical protein